MQENKSIDLLVVTHTDSDHIGGMLSLIKDENAPIVKEFWYNYSPDDLQTSDGNYSKKSIKQGIKVRDYLIKKGENVNNSPILSAYVAEFKNLKIQVLSPNQQKYDDYIKFWGKEIKKTYKQKTGDENDYLTKVVDFQDQKFVEDDAFPNGSSIAFLLSYFDFKILFLADSHPSVVVESLCKLGYSKENKLKVDYVKLSHHGSAFNISKEFIEMIDCENYIVLTDGSNHSLPNKKTLAKIAIQRKEIGTKFYFNYNNQLLNSIFTEQEKSDYKICPIFPESEVNYFEIKSIQQHDTKVI